MLTTHLEEILHRLRAGNLQELDTRALEGMTAEFLLAELLPLYRFKFQERRLGVKWEVGMAHALRYELVEKRPSKFILPILYLLPMYQKCIFVSGEKELITGVGQTTRLLARPTTRPFAGLALTTGRGFKVDRTVDGWSLKPLKKRTVKLTEESLRKRGWQFNSPWQVIHKNEAS